jgi:hypothetical protein
MFSLLLLRLLSSVLGTALSAVRNTGSIKSTADDVVTYTWKVLNTTATNKNDAVLLQVVSLSRDV